MFAIFSVKPVSDFSFPFPLAVAMASPSPFTFPDADTGPGGLSAFAVACPPRVLALDLLQRYREHAGELAVLLSIERASLRPEFQAKLDMMVEDNRAVMDEISDALARRRLHVVG